MSSELIQITVDGEPVSVAPGAGLLAVLDGLDIAVGQSSSGSPRGAFCAMGVCQECRVHVDGRPGVLACMTLTRAGMRVERRR